MQINRIENTKRNLFFGLINKMVMIILPFITITIIIYYLGVEYLGLNSLFSSLLSVLNLAELGFGSALVYSMYKPIAEDDDEHICCLLNFYKICYRIIGLIVFGAGLVCLPYIKYFIKDAQYPEQINIYIVYSIYLLNTVLSYLVFAYKKSLLIAYQRNDICSLYNTVILFVQYVLQILIIVLSRNYYVYLLLLPIATVVENVIIAWRVKRIFPNLNATGKLEKSEKDTIFLKVKALFFYKLGFIIANSVDNLVISAFLGLTVLAVYNNYFYIISALFGFLTMYYNSMSAGIGNSIVTENKEKNYEDFKTLSFIQAWLIGWCTICLICLFQPFMKLWVGEKYLFSNVTVVLFGVYFYAWKVQDVVHVYKEAAGMWEQDMWRPLIGGLVSLVGNLLWVKPLGVNGIILSTICASVFVGIPWSSQVLFRNYFKTGIKEYFIMLFKYSITAFITAAITYWICCWVKCDDVLAFIIRTFICVIVPNLLFWLYYHKEKEYLCAKTLILKTILRNK